MIRYRYDMQSADEAGENRHPGAVMNQLCVLRGVRMLSADALAIADCWLFEVDRELEPLPPFLRRVEETCTCTRVVSARGVVRGLARAADCPIHGRRHEPLSSMAATPVRVAVGGNVPRFGKEHTAWAERLAAKLDALSKEAFDSVDDPVGHAYRHAAAMVRGEQDENGDPT